jgi:hypothetical protein
MKANVSHVFTLQLTALLIMTATTVKAAFEGVYSLTPPSTGVYTNAGQFGSWVGFGGTGTVYDSSSAPQQLTLKVPTRGYDPQLGNGLEFEIVAAASGTVSFDASTINAGNGRSFYFWQPAGDGSSFYDLTGGAVGEFIHFQFQVQAGDLLGFGMITSTDVLPPDAPAYYELTLQNFSGPTIPEPGVLSLLAVGSVATAGVFLRGYNWRRHLCGAPSKVETEINRWFPPGWIVHPAQPGF